MSTLNTFLNNLLSKVGFSLSLLCSLHCVVMPLLIGILPTFSEWVSPQLESKVLFVSFCIGTGVLIKGRFIHKCWTPLLLFLLAFGMVCLNEILWRILLLEIAGSLLLSFSYLWNWQKVRRFRLCNCNVKVAKC